MSGCLRNADPPVQKTHANGYIDEGMREDQCWSLLVIQLMQWVSFHPSVIQLRMANNYEYEGK